MFHYMFKAKFVTHVSLKVSSGNSKQGGGRRKNRTMTTLEVQLLCQDSRCCLFGLQAVFRFLRLGNANFHF